MKTKRRSATAARIARKRSALTAVLVAISALDWINVRIDPRAASSPAGNDDVRRRSPAHHAGGTNRFAAPSPEEGEDLPPSCRPHLRLALPGGGWTNATKFRRLYFYHVRKAGGTNLKYYFEEVAKYHGLEFQSTEYGGAEDPGTHDAATFYVTHLREPVSRSISHFKYEGRWDCNQLVKNSSSFEPTEQNARKIETWNSSYGHHPTTCRPSRPFFKVVQCAVNCVGQWFAGLDCADQTALSAGWTRTGDLAAAEHGIARAKLRRYNLVVIMERLRDPAYVAALERFTGVRGASKKYALYCNWQSRRANQRVPLVVSNETLRRLTDLNEYDIKLYREMTDCPDEGGGYSFPAWDLGRFEGKETMREKGAVP